MKKANICIFIILTITAIIDFSENSFQSFGLNFIACLLMSFFLSGDLDSRDFVFEDPIFEPIMLYVMGFLLGIGIRSHPPTLLFMFFGLLGAFIGMVIGWILGLVVDKLFRL